MSKKRGGWSFSPRWVIGGLVVFVGLLIIAALFPDFLSTRVLQLGSPRLNAARGERLTIQVATATGIRKFEMCPEQRQGGLNTASYANCVPLKYFVRPQERTIDVTIPRLFPLGRAVVISRIRGSDGDLLPEAPVQEKIALFIVPARPATAPTTESGGGSSGGGDGGGGSSSGGQSSGSSEGASVNPPTSRELTVEQQQLLTNLMAMVQEYMFTSVDVPSNGTKTYDEYLDVDNDGRIVIFDQIQVRNLPESKSQAIVDQLIQFAERRRGVHEGETGSEASYEAALDLDGNLRINSVDVFNLTKILNAIIAP